MMNPGILLATLRFPNSRAILLSLLAMGWLWPTVCACASESAFARGNRLYAAGQFAEAAAAYEQSVSQRFYSANLFYNLGDAYYRAGDRGRAILNFDRALVLEPGHTEAAANLAFVRGRSVASGAEFSTGLLASLRSGLAGPGVDIYAWLAAGAFWLAAGGLLLALIRRPSRGAGIVLLIAGAFVGGGCVGVIAWLGGGLKDARRAVVLVDGAPALYAPADNAKTIIRLPVGSELSVLSAQGSWDYVRLPDGTRGWIASTKVGRIDPAIRG